MLSASDSAGRLDGRAERAAPSRRDVDGSHLAPLPDAISAADKLALQRRAARQREVQVQVHAAGALAQSRMREQSWQSGSRRASLFDEKHFLRTHEQKQHALQSRFSALYKPAAIDYWTPEAQARRAREARRTHISAVAASPDPTWRSAIPGALSLAHPALRMAIHDLVGPEPAEAPPAAEKARAGAVDHFTEAPAAFYAALKRRLADLRADVQAPPPQRPLPERTPKALIEPTAAPVPTAGEGGSAGADGDEMMASASAIYLTSMQYLVDYGIELPSWDEPPAAAAASAARPFRFPTQPDDDDDEFSERVSRNAPQ
jgi:hypothetical protein